MLVSTAWIALSMSGMWANQIAFVSSPPATPGVRTRIMSPPDISALLGHLASFAAKHLVGPTPKTVRPNESVLPPKCALTSISSVAHNPPGKCYLSKHPSPYRQRLAFAPRRAPPINPATEGSLANGSEKTPDVRSPLAT